ncbi:MAG: D-alanyl-D-alanine carboxypeptidase family protein [Patescibacteria group bacterium]
MSDDRPPIIETANDTRPNRFPVVLQLCVLGGILFVLFGSLLFADQTDPPPTTATSETTVVATHTASSDGIPQPITETPPLSASAAYVWDVRAQRALYQKNADEVLPLASITKLMTALVAYELVTENTEVAVPLSGIRQAGNSGLAAGETLDAEALSQLALISSSNDAAYSLAASVGNLLGGEEPISQFVAGMNIRAEELGLATMSFKNTTGLDLSPSEPGAVGSARDVTFLMEHIINNHPEIISTTRIDNTRIYNREGAYHEAANTNPLVNDIPNLLGSKTGYTDLAGGNLTVAFDAGLNRPIIVTVLGSTRNERFTDVTTLIEATQRTMQASE